MTNTTVLHVFEGGPFDGLQVSVVANAPLTFFHLGESLDLVDGEGGIAVTYERDGDANRSGLAVYRPRVRNNQ